MSECECSNIPHELAEGVLHDAIAHTDDKEEEERERISPCVENRNDDHEDFRENIPTVAICIFWNDEHLKQERLTFTYRSIPKS